jgi:hypothetical protein
LIPGTKVPGYPHDVPDGTFRKVAEFERAFYLYPAGKWDRYNFLRRAGVKIF